MIKLNLKFDYHTLEQITSDSGYRVYETPDGNRLPSVTTILDATSDKSAIENWRRRIGYANADYITKLSGDIGTCLHNNLECYMAGTERPKGNSVIRKTGRELSEVIIEKGLIHIDEIWGLEKRLYYPGLYAGTADVSGIWKGEEAIIDFKNTRKPKKVEWISNYFKQLAAYALAHNEVYGTNITKGVVMMAAREQECYGEYQEFEIDIADWTEPWLQAVEKFYAL